MRYLYSSARAFCLIVCLMLPVLSVVSLRSIRLPRPFNPAKSKPNKYKFKAVPVPMADPSTVASVIAPPAQPLVTCHAESRCVYSFVFVCFAYIDEVPTPPPRA